MISKRISNKAQRMFRYKVRIVSAEEITNRFVKSGVGKILILLAITSDIRTCHGLDILVRNELSPCLLDNFEA